MREGCTAQCVLAAGHVETHEWDADEAGEPEEDRRYLGNSAVVVGERNIHDLLEGVSPWCGEVHKYEDGSGGCLCTLEHGHGGKYHECASVGRWPIKGGEFDPAVDIIKTWPAVVSARTSLAMFSEEPTFGTFYFTLGRGRPKHAIRRLWFTYAGRIMGYFNVREVFQNDGSMPRLNRLDGGESDWQIRPDAWVAICDPPCVRLREKVFMAGFRGFRYLDFESYRETVEAKVRM